jgi:hypothetical protein
MAKNIEETLIHRIKKSFFSLQVDENTNIANRANFVCFVRYDHKGSIQEDFFFVNHFQEEQLTKCLSQSMILLFEVALTGKKCWTEQRWGSVNGRFPHWAFRESPSSCARLCIGAL